MGNLHGTVKSEAKVHGHVLSILIASDTKCGKTYVPGFKGEPFAHSPCMDDSGSQCTWQPLQPEVLTQYSPSLLWPPAPPAKLLLWGAEKSDPIRQP